MSKVTIREILNEIANLDKDYATTLNLVGFNKFDSPIGHYLVSKPYWTLKEFNVAKKLAKKYLNQYKRITKIFNIELDESLENNRVRKEDNVENFSNSYFGKISISGNHLIFKTKYNPDFVNLVKQFKNRKFQSINKTWNVILENNDDIYLLFHILSNFKFEVDIEKIYNSILKNVVLSQACELNYIEEKFIENLKNILKEDINLYPYQIVGIYSGLERIKNFSSLLLADQMGLGKTVQALVISQLLNKFPILIVCPKIMLGKWEKEILKFLKNIKKNEIVILNGSPRTSQKYKYIINLGKTLKDFKYVIINYQSLSKWVEIFRQTNFEMVIFDECHYIKNPKAQVTQASYSISEKIPYKIFLSGTPFLNRPKELVPMLEIGKILEYLAISRKDFYFKYCDAKYEEIPVYNRKLGRRERRNILIYDGASNTLELNFKLRNTFMIRREKEDVLKDLPPKVIDTILIELDKKQHQEYLKYENESYIHEIYNQIVNDKERMKEVEQFAKLNKFKEVNEDVIYSYIFEKYPKHLVKDNRLYELLGDLKIPYALEWIDEYYENNNGESKLVIFAYHEKVQNTIYNELIKKGYKTVKLSSEMGINEREKAIYEFQNNPDVKFIVVGIKVGAEGIDLTASNTALFVELWYNPQLLSQCEDRLHRISQNDTVFIYYLIVRNTLDNKIFSLINWKRNIFNDSFKKLL